MHVLRRSTEDIYGLFHVPRPDWDEPGVWCLLDHAATSILNGVFVTHIRCKMTASFRATATRARRRPFFWTSRSPQLFSAEGRVDLSSRELAAVYSTARTLRSPARDMRPGLSISPDWNRLGVSPKWEPTKREDRKRVGSSIAALNASAVTGPTPGAVISRRQTGSLCDAA